MGQFSAQDSTGVSTESLTSCARLPRKRPQERPKTADVGPRTERNCQHSPKELPKTANIALKSGPTADTAPHLKAAQDCQHTPFEQTKTTREHTQATRTTHDCPQRQSDSKLSTEACRLAQDRSQRHHDTLRPNSGAPRALHNRYERPATFTLDHQSNM